MNYGINYGGGSTKVVAILRRYTNNYKVTTENGTSRNKGTSIDFKYFVEISFEEYIIALTNFKILAKKEKEKFTEEQFNEAISNIGKEQKFNPLSKYTIVNEEYKIDGYSSKRRKELCSFFNENKGKMDIIILDQEGIPIGIIPPAITKDCMVIFDDFK